jgi:hypothetical protein
MMKSTLGFLLVLFCTSIAGSQIMGPLGAVVFSGSVKLRAAQASSVDSTSFTANWVALHGGSAYKLDVATDVGFSSYVSGYQNKSVSGTSQAVTTLTASTPYFYRVRATKNGRTYQSNTVSVITTSEPGFFHVAGGALLQTSDGKHLIVQ